MVKLTEDGLFLHILETIIRTVSPHDLRRHLKETY